MLLWHRLHLTLSGRTGPSVPSAMSIALRCLVVVLSAVEFLGFVCPVEGFGFLPLLESLRAAGWKVMFELVSERADRRFSELVLIAIMVVVVVVVGLVVVVVARTN